MVVGSSEEGGEKSSEEGLKMSSERGVERSSKGGVSFERKERLKCQLFHDTLYVEELQGGARAAGITGANGMGAS